MRLVFAGTPEVAVPSLRSLVASHHEVIAVLTRPDAPSGRGRRLQQSAVAAAAEELGIPVLKPSSAKSPELLAQLVDLRPDACAVVAYGAILPQALLDVPAHGWINLHFSVLPRWRGAAPVQRAIIAGDEEIGTTCFRIVPELDAGDVYRTSSQPLAPATAGEVLQELAVSGAAQLRETMDAVAAGEQPQPQATAGITIAPKLTAEEARISFRRSPSEVRNHILGCSPDPGAWCELDGQRLKVYRAAVAEAADLAPGQLSVGRRAVLAGTTGGAVELLEVQAPGKRRMPALDWARGSHVDGMVLS